MDRVRIYKGVTVSTIIAVTLVVKQDKIFEMKGIVESIELSEIPRVVTLNIKSGHGRNKVSMEIHEDILIFRKGDKVALSLHRNKPKFKKDDFLGVGIVMKAEKKSLLISIGGFLVSIEGKMKSVPGIGDKIYVKVSKIA